MSHDRSALSQKYQKKTLREQILLRPDTYIGSIQFDKQNLWVWNEEKQEIENREVTYVPGLYKIFGKSDLVLIL